MKLLTADLAGRIQVAPSDVLLGGAAKPPDVSDGASGPLDFKINRNHKGLTENGTIQLTGRRLHVPGIGRVVLAQKQVETAMKTGGIVGILWLLLSVVDGAPQSASARFPGWASPTDGPVFLAYYDARSEAWSAWDSTGASFPFDVTDDDVLLARIVRKSAASPGIEKRKNFVDNVTGRAPYFEPALAAPVSGDITAQGQVKQGKDGTTRAFLQVASNAVRSDADLFVRWRPAAGAYPGAIFAADFLNQVYQLDPDATDPGSQWHDAPRPLPGLEPSGRFGGFEGQPELATVDVATQWRERDDAGLVSPWLVTPDVAITEDTTPPGPVTSASVVLKRGVPRVKWTNPIAADFRRTNWRRGTTTVFADATPIKTPGSAEHFDDPEAAAGTPVYYFATTVDRTGNEDLGAYVMVGPVTPAPADFDTDIGGANKPAKNAGKITSGGGLTVDSPPSYYRALAAAEATSRRFDEVKNSAGTASWPSTDTKAALETRVTDTTTNGGLIKQRLEGSDGTWKRKSKSGDDTAWETTGYTSTAGWRKAFDQDNKPDWTADLANRPTELTDGRIPSAISSTGALQQASRMTLRSGAETAVAPQILTYSLSDGDVIVFDDDLGQTPSYFIDSNGLPTPAAGKIYSLKLNPLSSTGFTCEFKEVTPGTVVDKSTTAANSLSSPKPISNAFFAYEIVKGDAADANNDKYKMTVRLSWDAGTPAGQTATFGLFYSDGAGWKLAGNFTYTTPTAGPNSGTDKLWVMVITDVLSATAKFAVQFRSGAAGIQPISTNPIRSVTWKQRTDTAIDPVDGELGVIVFPQNT